MTFLNTALAFGALAFVIPLVIHILNRSRFKTIDWGAMHLLESVIKVNHKRFRLDQLILLLVRCLIPALLAFCIARPLLTSSKTMDADTPVSIVILLDASYSMDTMEKGGARFDKALAAAKQIVESTSKGSDIQVILVGSQSVTLFDQPILDSKAVLRRLDNVKGGFDGGGINKALQDGVQTLEEMSNAYRELVIISDFQKQDWQAILENDSAKIRETIKASKIDPRLTLIPIGKKNNRNVSVNSMVYPTKAIGAGEPHAYRVSVRNHDLQTNENVRVVFRVDGKEESVSQVSLEPASSSQVLFTHTFDQPGSHLVEVEVVADDALKTDNTFAVSMTGWEKLKVLLVDGDPDPNPLKSETDFLQVALTPYTLGRFQLTDLVKTETVSDSGFSDESLENSKVVVLANVKKLTDDQVKSLTNFVDQGGVLLVFPGDQIDLKWYREKLFDQGKGLLPTPFGPRKSNDSRPVKVVAQRFEHPSLEFFNEPENGDLSQAEIRLYYLLETGDPNRVENASAQSTIMARFDNADPFMMESRRGKGLVIQIATTCDADWNDLPMKPAFLPLIQQLITTTASRLVPRRNLSPGESARVVLDGDSDVKTIPFQTPDGSERIVETVNDDGQISAVYSATVRPGVYSFSGPEGLIHFSIQPSRIESNGDLLEGNELDQISETLDANVVASAAEYLSQDNLRRNGSEIWKYLLMAFLAFLFLEIVLQQRFSRVRV